MRLKALPHTLPLALLATLADGLATHGHVDDNTSAP